VDSITGISTSLLAVSGAVGLLTSNFEGVSSVVSTNTSSINYLLTATDSITGISTSLLAVSGAVGFLTSNFEGVSSVVSTNTSSITYLNVAVVPIEGISTGLSSLTESFAELSANTYSLTSSFTDVSTIVSTLSQYVLVLADFNITTNQNISTLSTATSTNAGTIVALSNNLQGQINSIQSASAPLSRPRVGVNEIELGITEAGLIVSTFISTNAYLNVFQNTSGTEQNLELLLENFAIWPNMVYDTMRFAHYGLPGTQCNVNLYSQDSNYSAGLLATMAPGDTISFIYKGLDPAINSNRVSTVSYYRVFGF
jgi:hypothetical protein